MTKEQIRQANELLGHMKRLNKQLTMLLGMVFCFMGFGLYADYHGYKCGSAGLGIALCFLVSLIKFVQFGHLKRIYQKNFGGFGEPHK